MSLTYMRAITDEEEKILLDSVVDIKGWIDGAIAGKLNSCIKRGAIRTRAELTKQGVTSIPSNDITVMRDLFMDKKYKNRKKRDDEELLK